LPQKCSASFAGFYEGVGENLGRPLVVAPPDILVRERVEPISNLRCPE
jgi:hypothetical protein